MKQIRIFIENLPETASESEIKSKFAKFGDVTSLEIKERKVMSIKNSSCFFAYVNLKINDIQLQNCFQTFSETPWCGTYVKLQIAKESFLERLKRERETNLQTSEEIHITNQPLTEKNTKQSTTKCNIKEPFSVENEKITSSEITEGSKTQIERLKRKKNVSTSSSDSSDEENIVKNKKSTNLPRSENTEKDESSEHEIQIKKPNRGAKIVNGLLKIEDFGRDLVVDDKTKKHEKLLDKRQAEAEARRKNALMEKIKAYRQQKHFFSEFQKKPKIIKFNDDGDDCNLEHNAETHEYKKKSSNKMTLFENSDSETDDLNIQKNIENRIKSDERFTLDERFFEDEKEEISNDREEIDLIKEKQKETEILEEILGQKVRFKSKQEQTGYQNGQRFITRFDPSKVDLNHKSKQEQNVKENIKMKKRTNEKKVEEKEAPEVSKERLHVVKVDLKSALGQSGGFSLSEIIGDTKEKVSENNSIDEEAASFPLPSFSLMEKNPYKFDSSDDEEETERSVQKEKPLPMQKPRKVWTEPFFFQDNDFRFQEGLDFVKRIATQERKEGEFEESRRQFKQIVRNKIKNAKKKNKPFQRKLGGSKKKKMKRMDKALKR